ncbi:hypothetical protein VHEMI07279 [[Torrubiella] hemipterigena]|uniref:Uncharacterized protein n=1 Tax=[Torrubiella] hemipterigena TaxID=1531966 RepID=A0A0A1TMM3_9HYPO|nr:hypothetical protein VHEMI07279 [[Torrubiella] hemipterigena]
MWVVLVVGILKKEYRGGRIYNVKKRLAALPVQLSALFKEIILRDKEHLDDLRLCVQWILFAKRPLKLEEYYFAMVSGLSPEALQSWDPDEVSKDDMIKLVLSSSKGLAETTGSRVQRAQFIHESVREFFLKDGLDQLWPGLNTDSFETSSHAQLQQCCYAYLSSGISDYMPSTLPTAASNKAKLLRASISESFPFVTYATHHIFYHADAAAKSVSQIEFLSSFPLIMWITAINAFQVRDIRRYTPGASFLYIFAENNFAQLMKAALDLDPSIEIKGQRYKYPLFAALANGSKDAVKVMLRTKAGSPPDHVLGQLKYGRHMQIGERQTLVSWVATKGDEPLVRLFFEIGCNFEATDDKKQTPLMHAAEHGRESVVRLLLDRGCYLEAKDYRKRTPLMFAAKHGQEGIVRLFLERGCDIAVKDGSLTTPLMLAAQNGHEATVRLLLAGGCDLEAKDEEARTPLIHAVQNGHERTVQVLLERGCNIEARDLWQQTSLMHAVEHGDESIVRLLLKNNCDIKEGDNYQKTPMMYAAKHGNERILQLLLESGCDVEAGDWRQTTSLMYAAQAGHEGIVRKLLENGANVDGKNSNGEMALLQASIFGHKTIIRLLLDQGADADPRDSRDGDTPLLIASRRGDKTIVRLLLDKKVYIDTKRYNGRTALMEASNRGNEPIIRLLLERGADITLRDAEGHTSPCLAKEWRYTAVVRLLQSKGAGDVVCCN